MNFYSLYSEYVIEWSFIDSYSAEEGTQYLFDLPPQIKT